MAKDKFLKQYWSPEQIQYRLRHEGSPHAISYATSYRGIYTGRFRPRSGEKRQAKGCCVHISRNIRILPNILMSTSGKLCWR